MTDEPQHDAVDPASWISTQATVTTCRFQFARLSNLAFGFSNRRNFRITFDYYAHGRLYSGEFQSRIAIPQNTTIPITYNPLDPQRNSRDLDSATSAASPSGPPSKAIVFTIGVCGSILLSIAWLAILRGCH